MKGQSINLLIMKRFILAVIAAVLGLASCEKENSNPILGTWEAEKIYMNIEGLEMTMDIKEMTGGSMEITFDKDGTATMTETIDGESYTDVCNYKYANNTLTLSYEGDNVSIPVTIKGDTLTMKVDPEMMDEEDFEGKIEIIFRRK